MSVPSVVLVTGAAGGLGAAIATRLANEHALLLTDLDQDRVQQLRSNLASRGATVAHAVCDVTQTDSARHAFDAAEAQLGEVTGLANVAGVGQLMPFTSLSVEQWDRTFAVNARGTFLTCQELIRRRAGRPGAIVNIASIGARMGMELLADYCASKAAVIELTHVVARIGGPTHLRANAVMPGLIWTAMSKSNNQWLVDHDPNLAGATAEAVFDRLVEQMVPMRRPQTAEDVAEIVAFLLSDRAANITGQTIAVDGGAVMT